MIRNYWKNEPHYKRILEIMYDYWLTEKDEFRVRVSLDFIKANGETQTKQITWQNPNYYCDAQPKTFKECVIDAGELFAMSDYELWQRGENKFWNTGKIYKRNKEEETND